MKAFHRKENPGFTLIELVVVLAIMAVLAHLAVLEASRVRHSKLQRAADRQLVRLASAVFEEGGEGAKGFLVDMGRLPRALPVDPDRPESPLSLRELWERPVDVAPYGIRPATGENLVPGVDGALADATVYVPCGWRGPYLRLPFHADRLLDPWGNAMESPDDARYSRLTDAGTNDLPAGALVELVRHFGSDGLPDRLQPDTPPEARDGAVRLAPPRGASSRLLVRTSFVDSAGVEDDRPGTSVTVRWYAPCGGAITAGTATAVTPLPVVLEGLPPGERFIRVHTLARTGMVRRVELSPGDNLHFERFPAR